MLAHKHIQPDSSTGNERPALLLIYSALEYRSRVDVFFSQLIFFCLQRIRNIRVSRIAARYEILLRCSQNIHSWQRAPGVDDMRVNCLVYPCQQEALLWLSLMASLIECRKGLLDSYGQRSQIARREFREIAVRMDHAESLPLNDLPGLVL